MKRIKLKGCTECVSFIERFSILRIFNLQLKKIQADYFEVSLTIGYLKITIIRNLIVVESKLLVQVAKTSFCRFCVQKSL